MINVSSSLVPQAGEWFLKEKTLLNVVDYEIQTKIVVCVVDYVSRDEPIEVPLGNRKPLVDSNHNNPTAWKLETDVLKFYSDPRPLHLGVFETSASNYSKAENNIIFQISEKLNVSVLKVRKIIATAFGKSSYSSSLLKIKIRV